MTRRIIIYFAPDGKAYRSPEFNGDKHDYELHSGNHPHLDHCTANWDEIFTHFGDIRSLEGFRLASDKAQAYYHSFLYPLQGHYYEPIYLVDAPMDLSADHFIVLGEAPTSNAAAQQLPFTDLQYRLTVGAWPQGLSAEEMAAEWNKHHTDSDFDTHQCKHCKRWHFWGGADHCPGILYHCSDGCGEYFCNQCQPLSDEDELTLCHTCREKCSPAKNKAIQEETENAYHNPQ